MSKHNSQKEKSPQSPQSPQSPHNEDQQKFNYQNLLDIWSKDQYQEIKKNISSLYKVSKKNTRSFLKQNLKSSGKNFQDFLMVQKAIAKGASKNMPYSTLALLGLRHGHPAYKQEIEKIIKDNVIKYKGCFYKLDDPEHQSKIRKALKDFQFEECSEIKTAA